MHRASSTERHYEQRHIHKLSLKYPKSFLLSESLSSNPPINDESDDDDNHNDCSHDKYNRSDRKWFSASAIIRTYERLGGSIIEARTTKKIYAFIIDMNLWCITQYSQFNFPPLGVDLTYCRKMTANVIAFTF